MGQTTVRTNEYSFKGGTIADMASCDVISRANSTRQRDTVTVLNATALTTLVLDGTSISVESAALTIGTRTNAMAYAIDNANKNVNIVSVGASTVVLESKNGAAYVISAGTTATLSVTSNLAYANSEIPFGSFVCVDTLNKGAARLVAAADDCSASNTLGVCVEAVTENATATTGTGYKTDTIMDIVCKGTVWARKITSANLTLGEPMYIRHTTGSGALPIGTLDSGADSATCTAAPFVKLMEPAATGTTYAKVRITL